MRHELSARWVWIVGFGASVAEAQSVTARDGGAATVADAATTTRGDDPEARRQQALDVYRDELARCVMVGRCADHDPFEVLPRSMRPWTRRGRGDGVAAWGPSPFDGVLTSHAAQRSAVSEAMTTVLQIDAQRLDAPPPPPYAPGAAPAARRRWALRTLAPWIDAQVHELTVLTTEMREARQLDDSAANAAPWAITAARYAQFAERLARVEALLTPADVAAIDAARGGPLPPPAVLLAWAREGFAACQAARSRRHEWVPFCDHGIADIDRAQTPTDAGVAPTTP